MDAVSSSYYVALNIRLINELLGKDMEGSFLFRHLSEGIEKAQKNTLRGVCTHLKSERPVYVGVLTSRP
jgi:hypothetical protein